MKIHVKSYSLLAAVLLGLTAGSMRAQILPINCGAVSTNTGAKLKFQNGDSFSAASGYVAPLTFQRISTRYGTNIIYCATNLQFTALSVKTNASTAAALGSYLAVRVVSVSGPPGGIFSFWEQGSGWPTYEFPVNDYYAAGKNQFILSNCENGAGRPDGDPFGAVRGRRFAVNKPGEYLVTFKLYDISKNHPTQPNTPIHTASDTLTMKFATKIDMGITAFGNTNGVTTLVYKQGFLTNMVIEASTNLTGGWTPVAGPFTNTPAFTTNRFTNDPSLPALYYRLHGVTP
jgi:hypothetical protein